MKNILLALIAGCLLLASCGNSESGNGGQLPVYFLVGEITPQRNDSYVVQLTKEDDIQHGRDLVQFGSQIGRPLVVARIRAGADNINRDLLSAEKTAWSWHVTLFEGFSDATIELIDGSPTLVESDVQGWISNTETATGSGEGRIGFWNYTIIQELRGYPDVMPLSN